MTQPPQAKLERYQKILLTAAWLSILVPLSTFIYFAYKTHEAQENLGKVQLALGTVLKDLDDSSKRRAALEEQSKQLESRIAEQQVNLSQYRKKADIVIQYYRESDRDIIEKVAKELDVPTQKGNSALLSIKPNSIYYGDKVSEQDYRTVAITLIESGFPLKSIKPAIRVQDKNLIQVVASSRADTDCGLLSVDNVRAGQVCGPT